MNVVLLGPPGAGKGTQGDLLSERCGIPKYATGDILREAVRRGTRLGREAQSYMEQGELVPDEVVLGLVREALASEEAGTGFILDGFPRTIAQAEGLEALLKARETPLDAVVFFGLPEEELVRRLSSRRVCGGCGAVYALASDGRRDVGSACAACGGRLELREDDHPETVRVRLRVYRENTEALLGWYSRDTRVLRRLDAVGTVEEVQEKLLNLLGCT